MVNSSCKYEIPCLVICWFTYCWIALFMCMLCLLLFRFGSLWSPVLREERLLQTASRPESKPLSRENMTSLYLSCRHFNHCVVYILVFGRTRWTATASHGGARIRPTSVGGLGASEMQHPPRGGSLTWVALLV